MAGYCKAICIGNLTRDPELRYTPGGDAVCNFDLAINRPLKQVDGQERREDVLFLRVTAWRKTAETAHKYLAKGKRALVEGYLKQDKWTTPEGVEKKKIGIVADRVLFLSPRDQGADGEQEAAATEDVPF